MNATRLRQSLLPATLLAGITLSIISLPLAALHAKSVNAVQGNSPFFNQPIESVLPSTLGKVISLGMGVVSVAIAGRRQAHRRDGWAEEAAIVLRSYLAEQRADDFSALPEMVSETVVEKRQEVQSF